MMEKIKIEISKRKLMVLLLGGIGFVFFSIWFIVKPADFVNFLTRSEAIVFTVGVVGSIVFGFATIILFIKLFDKKPGLIIDQEGITDNTTVSPVGLILWNDITKIEVKKINSINILLIYLQNPTDYISKANWINRFGLKNNMKTYGTPVTITSLGMQCSFKELTNLVLESYKLNKKG